MESAQHLKVNPKVAGQPCRACLQPLELAGDASMCTGCHSQHHRRCWDASGGCATPGCLNAPLQRLDHAGTPAGGFIAARPPAPGTMQCYSCRGDIAATSSFCPLCGVVTSPDGLYHGPKVNAPGAVASLVYAIIGLFFCGIILGPVAISKANSAKRAMAANPTYGGSGLATAGLVIGILDIVAFFIVLMARAGAS